MPLQTRPDQPTAEWQVDTFLNLAGGIHTELPADQIEAEQTPMSENLRFRQNRVVTDFGYKLLGGVVRGKPKRAFQHQTSTGAVALVLVTDLTFYIWTVAVSEWQYVQNGTTTDTDVTVNATDTLIPVEATTGFEVGSFVGILQDDGTQHKSIVNAVDPGVSITIDDGMASVATLGATVVEALVLNGTDLRQTVFIAVPSAEWSVFTNGIDPPHRYDGSDVQPIHAVTGSNLPSSTVCRTMSMYRDGFLVLLNIVEGGVERPYKLVWSDIGKPLEWSEGDSGFQELLDSRDQITAAKPFGQDLVIYRTRSMVLMSFVGIGNTIFEFNNLVYGESVGTEGVGAVSANAVYARADAHIILDRRGVFVYQGGLTIRPISSDIFSGTFDNSGDVDSDQVDKQFIFFMDQTNEVYCFYTELNAEFPGTFPDKVLILNMDNGIWRKRKFPVSMTFAAAREGGEGIRIIDLTGTIAEQSWTIGAGSASGANPVIMLGSESPLNIYEYDFASVTDDGTPVAWFHRTKKLSSYDRKQRLDQVEIVYRGAEAKIMVLGDDGIFSDYATIPAVGQLTRFVTDEEQIVRDVLQFEISGTGGCEIGSFSVLRREESRAGL